MGLFGKKSNPLPPSYAPEMPPSLSDADLANASALMDRWARSMGNNEAMWSCLEMIARCGGFRGAEAALLEVMDGKLPEDVTGRPWRWWAEASRVANARGNHVLVGQILLFMVHFVYGILPHMRVMDQADTGLSHPDRESYTSIGRYAVDSLERLPRDYLIEDTLTGTVDAASALGAAINAAKGPPGDAHPK